MSISTQTCRALGSSARPRKQDGPEPEIALLVSTYQKPWHLERTLTSIAVQEGVEDRMELVVTDDGSTDQTLQVVKALAGSVRFPVSWTTHRHRGFQLARSRNEGAAATTAPYLLFLDGDCVLPPDHVLTHLARRRPGCVMGGYCCRLDEAVSRRFDDQAIRSGKYLDWIPRSELRALARRDRKARFYQLIRHPRKPTLAGGNIGVWRRDFERVNGFDEHFHAWGGEDDDFAVRLRRSGVRVRSILRWTRTYHLWHPPDVTAPRRIRDGLNVRYLNRAFRLTRCMNGLVKRAARDLAVRLVGTPSRPSAVAEILKPHRPATAGKPPMAPRGDQPAEVELLFLPGEGRFSGRADCNVLVVLDDSPRARRMARKAHVLVADRRYPGVPVEHSFRLSQFEHALSALG